MNKKEDFSALHQVNLQVAFDEDQLHCIFSCPNTSARRTKSLTGGGLIRRLLVREKAQNFHVMALCVNQLKEARGRRGVCVLVLLCMSGASFLCVHSPLQTSPYRKVVANASQKVTKKIKVGLWHRVHRVATVTFWRTFHHDEKISEVGGCTPPPPLSLYQTTTTYKDEVYAPAERADTLSLFLLYP